MKKHLKSILAGCLLFVCAFLLMPANKAAAYGITQTGATQTSMTFEWTPESKAVKYHVYVGTTSSDLQLYTSLDPSTTSVTIQNLPAGCKRWVKVTYDYPNYNNTTTLSMTVGSVYDAITLPGKVTRLNQTKWWYWILKFDAAWDKQEGVTGYQYTIKTNTGKKKLTGKTTYNSPNLSVSNVKNNIIYTGQVRAYTIFNGKTYYGPWSDKAYFFTQPRITKAKVSKNKLTIKWAKVGGATGYDVYVSTKPTTGYKKVKSVSSKTSSVTIKTLSKKKFSSKKKYYTYIVTKKKVGKKTSTSGRLYYWNNKNSSVGYF